MEGGGFMDGINLDYFGDLFDHIDDLLDFPTESDNTHPIGIHGVWQDAALFPNPNNNNSAFSAQLSVPDEEDTAQLEWLSTFVEDSFSPGSISVSQELENNNEKIHNFQTHSPVSVLESGSGSSRCGGRTTMPVSPEFVVPGRRRRGPRSKRPRPTTFRVIAPTWSVTDSTPPLVSPTSSSEFENFAESAKSRKKKKTREEQTHAMAVRKCLHCEITKTPQWRAGPLGPKTLCNACGVRFKSGRLFPEYRPAASPTFVPKLHSNSHKKVIEMRGKTKTMAGAAADDEGLLLTELLPSSRLWDEYM